MTGGAVNPTVGTVWADPVNAAARYGCPVLTMHRHTGERWTVRPGWRLRKVTVGLHGARWTMLGIEPGKRARGTALARLRALAGREIDERGGVGPVVVLEPAEQAADPWGCPTWPELWRVAAVVLGSGIPAHELH